MTFFSLFASCIITIQLRFFMGGHHEKSMLRAPKWPAAYLIISILNLAQVWKPQTATTCYTTAEQNKQFCGGGFRGKSVCEKERGKKGAAEARGGQGMDQKLEGQAERLSEWFEMCPMQSFVMNYCSIELSLYSWLGLKRI